MGILRVNEIRQDQGGLFQGAGSAGAEIILSLGAAIVFGPFILFFLGLAAWKLWPTGDEIIGYTLLFGLFLTGVVWVAIYLRGHWAKSSAKINRAKIIHETEQGASFLHDGEIIQHTHTGLLPTNVMDGEFEEEGEREADYPKTFPEMVRDGYISPGADYVVAFDPVTGEAITWDRPTSLGIGGAQGTGKTVTTLSLMLQSVTRTNGQVRFLVADPHMQTNGEESLASKVEGLRPFFLTIDQIRETVPIDDQEYHALLDSFTGLENPTIGGEALEKWMVVVKTEMDRRLHGKDGDLWIIVIDEFSSVMRSSAARGVADMIETINQEARKMSMFAFLISQEWKGTRTGGTELRHSIASFVVHNMPPAIAELIVPFDVARKANTLTKGEVVFWTMGPSKRGMVPYTHSQDVLSMMLLYSPRPYRRGTSVREAPQIQAQRASTEVGWPATFPGQAAYPPMPPLDDIQTVQAAPASDGLPVGFDPKEVAATQAALLEGLSVQDTAMRVFGVRSAWATDRVKNMLKWLVQNGYRG